jgi:GTP-binding protein
MYAWLKHHGIPLCVVATKADKISRGQWQKHAKIVKETLEMDKAETFVLFSSETGLGKEELWSLIEEKIGYTAPDAGNGS